MLNQLSFDASHRWSLSAECAIAWFPAFSDKLERLVVKVVTMVPQKKYFSDKLIQERCFTSINCISRNGFCSRGRHFLW
jgi:hypothetical protein